jgi:hypothetical protein
MEMLAGTRTQLLGQLRASGFVRAKGPGDIRDLNKNAENWAVVKAALTAGCYPNLARFDHEAQRLRTRWAGTLMLARNANGPYNLVCCHNFSWLIVKKNCFKWAECTLQ